MSGLSEIPSAVRSISDLVGSLLDRADRDGPDNEKSEAVLKMQRAYIDNDLDYLGVVTQQLLLRAGFPPTPTGDAGLYRREIFHSLLLCAIQLIYERRLAERAIHKLTK